MSTQIHHSSDELEQLTLPQLQAKFREVIGETTRCPNRRFLIRRIQEALVARQEQAQADGERVIEDQVAEWASPQADTIETTAVPTVDDEPQADAVEPASMPMEEPACPPSDTIEMTSVPALDDASPQADRAEAMSESTADDAQANATEASDSTLDEATPQADTIESPSVTTTDADPSADTLETPSVPTTDAHPTTPRQRGRFGSMTIEQLQAKYLEVVGRATGSSDKGYLIWKIREAEKGRITIGPRHATERSSESTDVKILPLRLEAGAVERMDEAWRSRGIKNRMEFFRRALGHYLTHVGADDAAAMFAGAGSD